MSSNENILVDIIKNKQGLFIYTDKDIEYNKRYKYYIVAKSKYSNAEFTSDNYDIIIEKDFNKILENDKIINDNLSWMFA